MEIKCHIGIIVGWMVLSSNVAVAGQMYSIDSTQSWVSAYVPNWTAYNYTPLHLTGPDAPPPPPPTVVWNLDWALEKFQLSGTFQGEAEINPWAPGWASLAITNESLQTQLPNYFPAFVLSNFWYTVSDGDITDCAPYTPFSSGSCGYSGGGISLHGTFNGLAIDLIGTSVGAIVPGGYYTYGVDPTQQIANPGPPPHLDATLYPHWDSYRVVANAVPEPGTFPLIFLGIAALYQVNRRKLSS